MSTSASQLNFFLDNLSRYLPAVTSKKMFGEFGLYHDGIFFGLICDDRLFLRATEDLKNIIADDGIRPYNGASNKYYHIPDDIIEDEQVMAKIATASLNFTPSPSKKKTPKKKKSE